MALSKIDQTQVDGRGQTVTHYVETLPYFLDSDGVGLWVIVPAGKFFNFEGDDLIEFVRLCVRRLLDVGGVAVRHTPTGEPPLLWVEQTHYGTEPGEIVEGVIAEWLAAGGKNPEWDWLWFVTRDVLETEPNIKKG